MLIMPKLIPTLVAAVLTAAVTTPVFAQAAIQEPGAYAFYHPNADTLGSRPAFRSFDQTYAYAPREPRLRQGPIAPRHHGRAQ
jgi:hypothetical protein